MAVGADDVTLFDFCKYNLRSFTSHTSHISQFYRTGSMIKVHYVVGIGYSAVHARFVACLSNNISFTLMVFIMIFFFSLFAIITSTPTLVERGVPVSFRDIVFWSTFRYLSTLLSRYGVDNSQPSQGP